MVTVKQYADKMGIAVSTIRQMCANATLPSVKVGKSYRIFENEADAYFRQQWLDRKTAADEQKRRRTAIKSATRVSGSSYLERLSELTREVVSV